MKQKKHHRSLKHLLKPLFCSAIFTLLLSGTSFADSCITCHTDEDLLEENLAEVQTKVSEMQAGSG